MVVSLPPPVEVEVKTLPTLPISAPFDPERPGLVEEVPHLRGHVAEAGRRAEDDGVVVGELLRVGDRRRLIDLHAGAAHDLLRHQLGHALDGDLHAVDGAGAMRDRIGQRLDVAVGAVIENEQSRRVSHVSLFPPPRKGYTEPPLPRQT